MENEPSVPSSQPRRVALVVQNHTSNIAELPLAAFADTLTSRLSGKTIRIVNPHNAFGVNQNRTARGETMPEASAQEIGRLLNADGVLTASILEFTGEDIGVPAIAHTLKVRLALNLADAATGDTVCGVDGVEFSKNYTAEKMKSDTATLYEGVMHGAAAKAAEKLLTKVVSVGWEPGAVKLLDVFFGCNVLGADIQIDGQSYGTCPAQLSLTPGSHSLIVSYPPYYYEFRRRAMFNQNGQTYKVVLQLTPDGEAQRNRGLEYETKLVELKMAQIDLEKTKADNAVDYEKKKLALEKERRSIVAEQGERCELFKKQLELADAMLERYSLSGEADDYVRKVIADGTAVYWKNSFGRIAITDGEAGNIEFATPSTDAGDLAVPPNPKEIGEGLQKLLMKRVGR
ncbi:MAG: PEGA domain-containing protein [Kiritimatiellia bacterium]